MNQIWKQALP